MLEDIAILTGGHAVMEDVGIKLEKMKLDDLGRAKKIVIDKDNTTIVDGSGTHEAIEARTGAIKQQIDGALGSRGAWLLAPYDDLPASTGIETTPVPTLEGVARLAIGNTSWK